MVTLVVAFRLAVLPRVRMGGRRAFAWGGRPAWRIAVPLAWAHHVGSGDAGSFAGVMDSEYADIGQGVREDIHGRACRERRRGAARDDVGAVQRDRGCGVGGGKADGSRVQQPCGMLHMDDGMGVGNCRDVSGGVVRDTSVELA